MTYIERLPLFRTRPGLDMARVEALIMSTPRRRDMPRYQIAMALARIIDEQLMLGYRHILLGTEWFEASNDALLFGGKTATKAHIHKAKTLLRQAGIITLVRQAAQGKRVAWYAVPREFQVRREVHTQRVADLYWAWARPNNGWSDEGFTRYMQCREHVRSVHGRLTVKRMLEAHASLPEIPVQQWMYQAPSGDWIRYADRYAG